MRANIYIRKDNEELWSQLDDKSGFINQILSDLAEMDKETPIDPKLLCKVHKIPLDRNGRCMQKGCPNA